VNREHFKAFLWLRWRLRANQFKKAGAVNAVIFAIFAGFCALASVTLFVIGLMVGLFAFEEAPSYAHLFTWVGIMSALCFGWMIGLITDLQRSESLSLERFLHLPVSLSGAFVINYLSSLFSLTLAVFVPGAIGLIIGLTIGKSPVMGLLLPVMIAFVFALTAVTYQFQGWLASLMSNPRRRRTVIVLVTGGFILIAQAPNLINIIRPWEKLNDANARRMERQNELGKELAEGKVPPQEYNRRQKEINDLYTKESEEKAGETLDQIKNTARILSVVLPPGWVALSAEGLAEGNPLAAGLAFLGFILIGTLSLRRAFRTTLRLYTGEYTSKEHKPAAKEAAPAPPPDPSKVFVVERRLPWVSEHASAVATAGFRALTRAPEAKMAFLAPVIMVVVMGGLIASAPGSPIAALRPLIVFGAGAGVLLISGLQLLANQFGYDRGGFRAYVLCPAARRDILLGKNLAVAPLVLALGLLGFLVLGVVFPMRPDHYPAVLCQLLSTFFVLCMLCNVNAILTPIPLAAGSMQPASIKTLPILMQFVLMMLLPVCVAPILIPYGLEVLLDQTDVVHGLPISLVGSVLVLGLVVVVYRAVIRVEGAMLHAREQKVLEVVTQRAE
jgi:ABC-2 type transport system permease protein